MSDLGTLDGSHNSDARFVNDVGHIFGSDYCPDRQASECRGELGGRQQSRAANLVGAFIAQINAQRGRTLSDAQGDAIITVAAAAGLRARQPRDPSIAVVCHLPSLDAPASGSVS